MKLRQTIRAVFPMTIPVLTGYLFMGAAFGILLHSQGYNVLWAVLMSVCIFAGAMQFVAVDLLAAAFAPLSAVFITLMVNARHLFYGVSMLDRLKDMGKAKPYLIFSLTDETFSLYYSAEPPEWADPKVFYTCIAALNHLYWITGSAIGALIGSLLPFDTFGVEFVMTALFVSIYVEQWRSVYNRIPALIGLLGSLGCLLVFGPDNFLLPAMAVLILGLTLARAPVERGLGDR